MDLIGVKQQMINNFAKGALEQIERAVDDEIERTENLTVRASHPVSPRHCALRPSRT